MMEIKQNTSMDFNDLMSTSKSDVNTSVNDGDSVMTDLTLNNLENHLITTASEKSSPITEDRKSVVIGIDNDLDVPVSAELEDVLLAGDDVVSSSDNIGATVVAPNPTIVNRDKLDSLTSIISSTNDERNVGDDLDTLLSKINDIVQDDPVKNAELKEQGEEDKLSTEKIILSIEKENHVEKSDSTTEKPEIFANKKDKEIIEEIDTKTKYKLEIEIDKSKAVEEVISQTGKIEIVIGPPSENLIKSTEKSQKNLSLVEEIVETSEEAAVASSSSTIDEVPMKKNLTLSQDISDNSVVRSDKSPLITTKDFTAIEENSAAEKKTTPEIIKENKTEEEQKIIEDTETSVGKAESAVISTGESNKDAAKGNTKETVEVNCAEKDGKMPTLCLDDDELQCHQPKEAQAEQSELKTEGEEKRKKAPSDNVAQKEPSVSKPGLEGSDDEIEFFVEKSDESLMETDDLSTTEGKKSLQPEKTVGKGQDKSETLTEISITTNEKDTISNCKENVEDVVVLDDEEEDDETNKVKTMKDGEMKSKPTLDPIVTGTMKDLSEENKTLNQEPSDQSKPSLQPDNSDNARDDFNSEKSVEEKCSTPVAEADEMASNCSSSSNLLQEAKPVEGASEDPSLAEADNENEDDDDNEDNDADLEIVETELKVEGGEERNEDEPASKRTRLNQENEESTNTESLNAERLESTETQDEDKTAAKTQPEKEEQTAVNSKEEKMEGSVVAVKRSHDVIEIEGDDVPENLDQCKKFKRAETPPKQEPISSPATNEEKSSVKLSGSLKFVPSDTPIPLYPPPIFDEAVNSKEYKLSLDFYKKFHKSFNKMTKQDLEELVLQKLVEAIIHKSEFADMRDLVEKQEKIICSQRNKLTELTKQFRDLEMVHSRVVKDIEQRNSQFIMPVKITRAVGLQVYIPNKKPLAETGGSSTQCSPQRPQGPLAQQLVTPQRPIAHNVSGSESLSASSSRINNIMPTAVVPVNVRRGCVQKITPTRPMNSAAASSTPNSSNSVVYRTNSLSTTANQLAQPRILNKNIGSNASATVNSGGGTVGGNATMQRSQFSVPARDPQRQQLQQQPPQLIRTVTPASGQRASTPNVNTQSKPLGTDIMQRRSDIMVAANNNNNATTSATPLVVMENYLSSINHLSGTNTSVSITPAKPKEKAVIDLTDEDEAPSAPPASVSTGSAVISTTSQRRSLPSQSNFNTPMPYSRPAPPLARVTPSNQIAANKLRAIAPMPNAKNSIYSGLSAPSGTSITRLNMSANSPAQQRLKYSHPAPLPTTPPQNFNPSWKLPPPRPTIRISNLDNGIVISWTMEESLDHYDDCVSYQIYAYQETAGPPSVDSWRHVGDVKAMLLPMAVTLTQFQEGQRYYFAVRAVDCHQRYGPFSLPKTWS
uniref:Fibronectin type-III domain-containing protein n=1 Tax=Glossina morsitans morsitans TaxID=37546 RepID=A0A1B0FJS7_GLOMM